MAYDIAKGLDYLSEQKYVHRDIACRCTSSIFPFFLLVLVKLYLLPQVLKSIALI